MYLLLWTVLPCTLRDEEWVAPMAKARVYRGMNWSELWFNKDPVESLLRRGSESECVRDRQTERERERERERKCE